jgi:hypothetical protein
MLWLMSEELSDRVRWLLSELCHDYGLCLAGRHSEGFEALVREGPGRFTEAVFLAEGMEPAEHRALLVEVRAHVTFIFDTWGIAGSAV